MLTRCLHDCVLMAKRINKSLVDELAAGEADGSIRWDCDLRGFGVRRNKNGTITYLVQYRLGGRTGRTRRITIGRHGSPWTPAEARTEARRLLGIVATGQDPAAYRDAQDEKELTVAEAADAFFRLYLIPNWPRSYADAKRVLDKFLVPNLGNERITDISRRHFYNLLDNISDRPAHRKYCHSVFRKFSNWLADQEFIPVSPLHGAAAPKAVPPRNRVLSPRETWAIWNASSEMGFPFGPLTRMLLITAQRRSEVAGIRWEELTDWQGARACWHIPGARMKMARDQLVPLSTMMVEELRTIEPRQTGLILSTTGTTPPSGFSKARNRLHSLAEAKLGQQINHFRWHDFRRTASTGMQACGVPVEVTERVLAHRSGTVSGVAAVYNLHDYQKEKRDALNNWAACLEWLSHQKNVSDVPDSWTSVWLLVNGASTDVVRAFSHQSASSPPKLE